MKNKLATFLKRILPRFIRLRLREIYFFCWYLKSFFLFRKMSSTRKEFRPKWRNRNMQLGDNTTETNFDRHYIYHPAWAARIVKKNNPEFHIDISSTLNFSTLLSAFIPVHFYDYRPAQVSLSGLTSEAADLLHLPFKDNSVLSLSCMHTVEHIGLGRYGDPLDPEGDLKAMQELARVLAPGGTLLFVVPVGKPKVQFNAHRIYSYEQIITSFQHLHLEEFSLITSTAGEPMIKNATGEMVQKESYGCGCFWFIKK